ncbi:MAG: ribosome biogenesis GTPase YlqF [Eubacteriaceae bacterium]|nr:ribosome biogenesis GTPase YlqF [Eubacteriaceae bacterium]
MQVQWFPGHMAKALRLVKEQLKTVDIVIEVCDARAPISSRNNELSSILNNKKRVIAFNKSSLADDTVTQQWESYLNNCEELFVFTDALTHKGVKTLSNILINKISANMRYNRAVKAMVVGLPNVGKSMLINSLTQSSGAKTGNRPGVTRGNQWIRINSELHLLDTPGVLMPKIESEEDAFNLAAIGCVKDTIFDKYAACKEIIQFLKLKYPHLLKARYKLENIDKPDDELISDIALKRGFILKGGEIDLNRCTDIIYDEFKNGVIGKISLQSPHII